MPNKDKKSYKDKHGTTRVGDFLRTIGKGEVIKKVLGVVGGVVTGGGLGAVIEAITGSKDLTAEEREYALKLAELDFRETEEITKRWEADMVSDSWMSKNIRPYTLVALTASLLILVGVDSSIDTFIVESHYIDMLKFLLGMVYGAYFGGRSAEKIAKIIKKL